MGTNLNRESWKDETQMIEKDLNKYSISLLIRERQIKITLRFHFSTVRMASINKINTSPCWRRQKVKRMLIHWLWDCKFVQPVRTSVWLFIRKMGIDLAQDPDTPLLGIYPMIIQATTETSHHLCSLMY